MQCLPTLAVTRRETGSIKWAAAAARLHVVARLRRGLAHLPRPRYAGSQVVNVRLAATPRHGRRRRGALRGHEADGAQTVRRRSQLSLVRVGQRLRDHTPGQRCDLSPQVTHSPGSRDRHRLASIDTPVSGLSRPSPALARFDRRSPAVSTHVNAGFRVAAGAGPADVSRFSSRSNDDASDSWGACRRSVLVAIGGSPIVSAGDQQAGTADSRHARTRSRADEAGAAHRRAQRPALGHAPERPLRLRQDRYPAAAAEADDRHPAAAEGAAGRAVLVGLRAGDPAGRRRP